MQKFLFKLMAQISFFFFVAFASTYLTDYLVSINFFKEADPEKYINDSFNCHYMWSSKHYIYAWFKFIIFCMAIVRIVIWAFHSYNKEIIGDSYYEYRGKLWQVIGYSGCTLTLRDGTEVTTKVDSYPTFVPKHLATQR